MEASNGQQSQTSAEPAQAPGQQLNPNQRRQAEVFLRALADFHRARGSTLPKILTIEGRTLDLVVLYAYVMKAGGSPAVDSAASWPQLAQMLHFPGHEQEMRKIYIQYMQPYEMAVWESRRKKAQQQTGQPEKPNQGQVASQVQMSSHEVSTRGASENPDRQLDGGRIPGSTRTDGSARLEARRSTDQRATTPRSKQVSPSSGAAIPADGSPLRASPQVSDFHRGQKEASMASMQETPTPTFAEEDARRHNASATSIGTVQQDGDASSEDELERLNSAAELLVKDQTAFDDPSRGSQVYLPLTRTLETHGGTESRLVSQAGDSVHATTPYPSFPELGGIDVQALTRSLQSGLPAECLNSIDVLTVIANDRRWGLPLSYCHDLTEALCSCLLDATSQISNEASALRVARHDRHLYGTLQSHVRREINTASGASTQIDSTYSRILGLLTILRSLAFTEINQPVIGSAHGLAPALSAVVQELVYGTHGTAVQALDIAQEVITLLALVGADVPLTRESEADILLHFVAGFGHCIPTHAPRFSGSSTAHDDGDPFSNAAIDAAAKLITRNDPNRSMLARMAVLDEGLLDTMLHTCLNRLPLHGGHDAVTTLAAHLPICEHALIVAETVADLVDAQSDLPFRWLKHDNLAGSMPRLLVHLAASKEPSFQICIRRMTSILSTLATKARRQARLSSQSCAAPRPCVAAARPLAPADLMSAAFQNLPLPVLETLELVYALDDLASFTTPRFQKVSMRQAA